MSDDPKRVGSIQRGKDGRWHEYHGVGEVLPDGSCEFDDDTESGRHSHAIHGVPDQSGTSRITRHRHEGAGRFCDEDDCDDRYGSYGRSGQQSSYHRPPTGSI